MGPPMSAPPPPPSFLISLRSLSRTRKKKGRLEGEGGTKKKERMVLVNSGEGEATELSFIELNNSMQCDAFVKNDA